MDFLKNYHILQNKPRCLELEKVVVRAQKSGSDGGRSPKENGSLEATKPPTTVWVDGDYCDK